MNFRVNKRSLLGLILTGETSLLRLWFSIWSFGWAFLAITDRNFIEMHKYTSQIAPIPVLAALFAIHATALLYGVVTRKFNTLLLFLEGVLGVFLWAGVGIAEIAQYHSFTPASLAGFTALFLLIRYPTHYTDPRGGKE